MPPSTFFKPLLQFLPRQKSCSGDTERCRYSGIEATGLVPVECSRNCEIINTCLMSVQADVTFMSAPKYFRAALT